MNRLANTSCAAAIVAAVAAFGAVPIMAGDITAAMTAGLLVRLCMRSHDLSIAWVRQHMPV